MVVSSLKIRNGFFWLISGAAGQQIINLLITVILARLILPKDFGVIALVTAFISVLQLFSELGTSVAIIQRKEIDDNVIDSAFIMTMVVTFCIVLIIILFAPFLALFFNNSDLDLLFKIAAFSYLFRGLYSLYNCLLLREIKYSIVSMLMVVNNVIYGLVAIALAYLGFGAFSVVWGQLSASALLLILGCLITGYFPKTLGTIKQMKNLFSFGFWVSANRLISVSAGQVDAFIIIKLVDAASLGFYSLAQKIIMVFPSMLSSTLDKLLLPVYSKSQDNIDRIKSGYWTALIISSYISLPIVFLLFLLADPIIPLLAGCKWYNSIILIRIMSIFVFMQCLGGGIFSAVIYALGKPKLLFRISIFRLIMLPLCIIGGSFWGVIGIAWGFSAYAVIGRCYNQIIIDRLLEFPTMLFINHITKPVIINTVSLLISTLVYLHIPRIDIQGQILNIFGSISCYILVYTFLIYLIDHKNFVRIFRLLYKRELAT